MSAVLILLAGILVGLVVGMNEARKHARIADAAERDRVRFCHAAYENGLAMGLSIRPPVPPRVVLDGRVEHWELPDDESALSQLILPSPFAAGEE